MFAAQFPGRVRERVLVDGRVCPELWQRLYDDASVVYRAALTGLRPSTERSRLLERRSRLSAPSRP